MRREPLHRPMIKVYQYGCLPPKVMPEEAPQQLRMANHFWNALVECDRDAQQANQTLWSQQEPIHVLEAERDRLLAALEVLRTATNQAKQQSRSGRVDPTRREEAAALRAQLKVVRQQIKETKAELRPKIAEAQQQIWEAQKAAEKAARQTFAAQGLYWGTYNAVARHFKTASIRAHKEGTAVRFHAFSGEGTWTVQIQTETNQVPATMNDLFDPSSRVANLVRVNPIKFQGWDTLRRGERRRRARTTLHLRVASNPDRSPVWLDLPMVMDRPMPEAASIKQVEVTRRRIGRNYRYTVAFTVDEPPVQTYPAQFPDAIVAVDLGWRKREDGLRVGTWVGSNAPAAAHEVLVPNRLIGGFAQADRIKSHRETLFNGIQATLGQWLHDQSERPEWLIERTQHLAQWRGHGRLMRLIDEWEMQRVPEDAEIWAALEAWRKRERHLEDFEVNLRDRLVRWRREIFRVAAAELAEQYTALMVEAMDLRTMAKRPPAEQDTSAQAQAASALRQLAAPGLFRQALIAAFHARGREVYQVPAENTTRVHAECGTVVITDYAAEITVFCPRCQVWYDQDVNACRNLLHGQRDPIPAR